MDVDKRDVHKEEASYLSRQDSFPATPWPLSWLRWALVPPGRPTGGHSVEAGVDPHDLKSLPVGYRLPGQCVDGSEGPPGHLFDLGSFLHYG
ncbi:hypothetical protein AAFF_G00275050 [Aldrovandia affinis]|uniref:Uncharacterized protein n=1 Tax=Aldrovandia affinis TaxID=143900 RepID=A0AAD7SS57_9TELE|nr:hypothetical protein AAFF_G00275050 [Aldrovandia affinis]